MSYNPLVTVIMSVYNESPDFLKLSIESILNQTYYNLQFIIVLDNPNNLFAKTLITNYMNSDSRILFLENKQNQGLVYSLNKALRYAKGEYIARMDADDISFPNRIEKELSFLIKSKSNLIGSYIIDFKDEPICSGNYSKYPSKHLLSKWYLHFDSSCPHPTWFGEKKVFDDLKGYRDIEACEDYDFLLRATLMGYSISNAPEPLLFYRINNQGISATKKIDQKISLSFLRDCYRDKIIPSIDDYLFFFYGAQGDKLRAQYEDYYLVAQELKNSDRLVDFIVKGITLFWNSSIARMVFKNVIVEKVLLILS